MNKMALIIVVFYFILYAYRYVKIILILKTTQSMAYKNMLCGTDKAHCGSVNVK